MVKRKSITALDQQGGTAELLLLIVLAAVYYASFAGFQML
jgi:hypothetical protein